MFDAISHDNHQKFHLALTGMALLILCLATMDYLSGKELLSLKMGEILNFTRGSGLLTLLVCSIILRTMGFMSMGTFIDGVGIACWGNNVLVVIAYFISSFFPSLSNAIISDVWLGLLMNSLFALVSFYIVLLLYFFLYHATGKTLSFIRLVFYALFFSIILSVLHRIQCMGAPMSFFQHFFHWTVMFTVACYGLFKIKDYRRINHRMMLSRT